MKKLLFIAFIFGGAITFTSCGKDECKCDDGTTYTEADAKDAGTTLGEACTTLDALKSINGGSCSIQ